MVRPRGATATHRRTDSAPTRRLLPAPTRSSVTPPHRSATRAGLFLPPECRRRPFRAGTLGERPPVWLRDQALPREPRRITRPPRTTPDPPPPMTTPRRPVTRPQRSTRARRDSAAGWPVRRPPVSARAAALPAWLPPITVFTGAPHLTVAGRTAARV